MRGEPCSACAQLCPTLCNPMDCSPPGSSVHGTFPGKNTGMGCHSPPGDLPDPGIEPVSPALAGGFFTAEPAGEPTVVHEKERKISFLPRDGSSGLLTGICSHRGGPALGNRRVKTLLQLRVQILGRPQVPGLHLSGLLPWGSGQTSPDCPWLAQPCYSCPRLRFLGFQNLPAPLQADCS